MTVAEGVFTSTRFKRQSALGTISGTSNGQVLRRKTASFELKRDVYNTTDEIASHQQMISERQGTQVVDGKISGLVSPGTYSDLFSAVMRKDFASGVNSGALTDVTAAVTTGAAGTFTTAGANWLTLGFKIGDVVRWTGWATTGVPNNSHNFLITALTATVMTVLAVDAVAVGAKASGDSVTATVTGKKSYVPATSHTNIYYTFEQWSSDASTSFYYKDCKIGSAAIKVPGSGNVETDLTIIGLDETTAGSVYFTAPTAETTSDIVASATGVLVLNGTQQVIVTGLDFTIDGQESAVDGVVGSNLRPLIQRKKVLIKGSFTAFFENTDIHTLFKNETEIKLLVVTTAARTAAADFITFIFPRIKIQGSAPDDGGEKAQIRTYQFTALYNSAGGTGTSTDQTTFAMQDSLAA